MSSELKKILVVDDNSVNLTMIKGILSNLYNVYPVNSGATALKFISKQTPDLILLDKEMPVMNGLEVLQAIKENPDLSEVPVIFLTGNRDMQSEAEAIELGVSDYMCKPVNDVILLHRVKMQLELVSLRKRVGSGTNTQ